VGSDGSGAERMSADGLGSNKVGVEGVGADGVGKSSGSVLECQRKCASESLVSDLCDEESISYCVYILCVVHGLPKAVYVYSGHDRL
jgi:hypothetical protein